jgi:hypothetical protein
MKIGEEYIHRKMYSRFILLRTKNLFPGMLFLDQYVDKLSDCQHISLKNLDYYFRTHIDLGRHMLTH